MSKGKARTVGSAVQARTRRSRVQLQELQRILDGKKASLRNSYRAQTEANNKVWEVNGNAQKAMALLARTHEKFEDSCKAQEVDEKCEMIDDVEKMVVVAAKEGEVAAMQLRKAWERLRNVANVFDKVEEERSERGSCRAEKRPSLRLSP